MNKIDHYRAQADACRRLATQVTNSATVEQFRDMAAEFDRKAERLEQHTAPVLRVHNPAS